MKNTLGGRPRKPADFADADEITDFWKYEASPESGIRRRVAIGFVAGMLLTCFVGLVFWYSARLSATEADWVVHTRIVLNKLSESAKDAIDVETSARGYSLTGEEIFLEPSTAAQTRLPQDIEDLRRLVQDNPEQERRADRLKLQVDAVAEISNQMVMKRRRAHVAPDLELLREAKRRLDAVRSMTQQMEAAEDRLLSERSLKTKRSERLTTVAAIVGTIVGLGVLLLTWMSLRRQVELAALARAEVSKINNELEHRVEERTVELEAMNRSLLAEVDARTSVEAEVREVKDRLSGIIDSAMDAIVTIDGQQCILLFNQAAEKMFGCKAEEVIGQSVERLLPERFRARHSGHIERFGAAATTNRAMGALGAVWGRRANGDEFPIEASISQVETAGKKLFSVILRDITDRLHNEEQLRQQAQVLGEAQVFVLDMDHRIVFWPQGAERLYGFTSQEALGVLSHELFQTQFPESFQAIQTKLVTTGAWNGELVQRRRDGSLMVVASTWVLHRDSQGQATRLLQTNTDITGRKRAEEQLAMQAEQLIWQAQDLTRTKDSLREQSRILELVLNSMGEGLVAVDQSGKFLIWNPAAQKILGRGPAAIPAAEWSSHYDLYLSDGVTPLPSSQLPLVRAMAGSESEIDMVVHNPQTGKARWIEVTAHPLRDIDGTARGGVAAFRDVTQRKSDEREIRRLNEDLEHRVQLRTAELEASNKELEAFTYSVSHDLRAPLRHITGFTRILIEEFSGGLPAEAKQYLQRVEHGTQRMGILVDELLKLTRIGRQALDLRPAELDSAVRDVIAMLEPEIGGRTVEWKIGELPSAKCDPILIRQVFQNLIANALKYSRPRSPAVIEIGIAEHNGRQTIFVRDNGVGFSMKYADKLFGVFQRLHKTEEFEGTGVGLATVHRIIQKHGGQIWAEAEVDHGATFYFTLSDLTLPEPKNTAAKAGGPL